MNLSTPTAATPQAAPPASLRWVLASLALGMLLPSLGTSIASVALPTLAEAFHAAFQQVQWVVLAYLLVSTTLLVSVGRLGDLLGRRRLLLAGVALFTVASGLCGLAQGLAPAAFGVAGYLAPLAVLTVGYALFQAANNTAVMAKVPADQRGVTSGLLNLARNLGLITGASLMGAVFAWSAGAEDFTTASGEAVAHGMQVTFALAAGLLALGLGLSLSHRERK